MKTMYTAVVMGESDETQNSSTLPIITSLHPDILRTHILTRLDGPTLVAVSCVSFEPRHLCSDDESLWCNVCTTTWPSLLDPIASRVISIFPDGHRSFFSDAFPSLHYFSSHAANHGHHKYRPPPPELISAVDIYYQGKPFFSTVLRTKTSADAWIDTCSFCVDDIQPISSPLNYDEEEERVVEYLQENLRLSWIIIDPTRKREANMSSWKPVKVQRGWLERDLVHYKKSAI